MNMGRPRGRSKKPKCIVPKCKNTPSRMTPEGEPVCRTHLARRNMFGAVDAESPTIPSVGKRNLQYKNGFNVVSATQERQSGYIEDSVNLKTKFKNNILENQPQLKLYIDVKEWLNSERHTRSNLYN